MSLTAVITRIPTLTVINLLHLHFTNWQTPNGINTKAFRRYRRKDSVNTRSRLVTVNGIVIVKFRGLSPTDFLAVTNLNYKSAAWTIYYSRYCLHSLTRNNAFLQLYFLAYLSIIHLFIFFTSEISYIPGIP